MITVGNVKIRMKYVNTFGTGRHNRQADITLLFQYIYLIVICPGSLFTTPTCTLLPQICSHYVIAIIFM